MTVEKFCDPFSHMQGLPTDLGLSMGNYMVDFVSRIPSMPDPFQQPWDLDGLCVGMKVIEDNDYPFPWIYE